MTAYLDTRKSLECSRHKLTKATYSTIEFNLNFVEPSRSCFSGIFWIFPTHLSPVPRYYLLFLNFVFSLHMYFALFNGMIFLDGSLR